MPESKDKSWGENMLPLITSLYSRLDEPKELDRVVLNLAVDLPGHRAHRQRRYNAMRRWVVAGIETDVELDVAILRHHEDVEYLGEQGDRLMRGLGGSNVSDGKSGYAYVFRSTHSKTPVHGCLSMRPSPSVVRSSSGSWNMTRTLSDVMCMSEIR